MKLAITILLFSILIGGVWGAYEGIVADTGTDMFGDANTLDTSNCVVITEDDVSSLDSNEQWDPLTGGAKFLWICYHIFSGILIGIFHISTILLDIFPTVSTPTDPTSNLMEWPVGGIQAIVYLAYAMPFIEKFIGSSRDGF